MKLSERLMTIAQFVEKDSIVADIGTDHGYIPVYLIENKISKFAIATDISPGSLEKIIAYVEENKLENYIDTRLGDGLDTIKAFEVDTAIIAGMGGLLISEILDKNKEITNSISYFILQPMVASEDLRRYLIDNKFQILDESLAREGSKYYEIILAKKGLDRVERNLDYDISPILIKKAHPLLEEFILSKIEKLEEIRRGLDGIDTAKVRERCEELEKKIETYREVMKEIEG